MSTTFGDLCTKKNPHHIRIGSQNIRNMPSKNDDPKNTSIYNTFQELELDVLAMQETNINWTNIKTQHSLHNRTRTWFENKHISNDWNTTRHYRLHRGKPWQPGGVGIFFKKQNGYKDHWDTQRSKRTRPKWFREIYLISLQGKGQYSTPNCIWLQASQTIIKLGNNSLCSTSYLLPLTRQRSRSYPSLLGRPIPTSSNLETARR